MLFPYWSLEPSKVNKNGLMALQLSQIKMSKKIN